MHRPLKHLYRCLLPICLCATFIASCGDKGSPGGAAQGLARVPELQRPTLSFYHIPECFLCSELQGVIDSAEKRFRSQMTFRTVDYHLPASQEAIKRLRIKCGTVCGHSVAIAGCFVWGIRRIIRSYFARRC